MGAKLRWDPFSDLDPGPCIKILVANSDETIEAGRAIGLEYPGPQEITALLDTGSPFTIISQTFATNRKLFLTSPGTRIRTLSGDHYCAEYSAAIRFPRTNLRPIPTMRVLATNFQREPHHACLIGRDILRNWTIKFDGRGKYFTIED